MDYFALALSWYFGCFLMSVFHGINRYRRMQENRIACIICVVGVSLVWPIIVPILLFVVMVGGILAILWETFWNGGKYLSDAMDAAIRKATK